MLWIGIVYLAGVATFLTLAERAPLNHDSRYSDDDQGSSQAPSCRMPSGLTVEASGPTQTDDYLFGPVGPPA